jgi:TfoX/Sxy family transcriptional regulator of competence genes
MAFDEQLAERVRERLGGVDRVVELKMFGGWGVTIHGNMAVGVMERDLIVRVGPDAFADALTRTGARPFDFTGRPMTGWVYVAAQSVTHGRALDAWVRRGVEYAQSLPAKSPTKRSGPRRRAAR